MASSFKLIVRPRKDWQPIDFEQIFLYRELLAFLVRRDMVWREFKIRYGQTLLGGFWELPQRFIAMVIFTFIFHRLAGVKSDGPPYPFFAFAGLVPWTFFPMAVSRSTRISVRESASRLFPGFRNILGFSCHCGACSSILQSPS
jgi:lipopolysaccharide transport system permease protein